MKSVPPSYCGTYRQLLPKIFSCLLSFTSGVVIKFALIPARATAMQVDPSSTLICTIQEFEYTFYHNVVSAS